VREVEVRACPEAAPAHHSEASLLEELERRGVGRPSTYAAIVETLLDRGYVQRNQGFLVPTPLGEEIEAALEELLPDLLDPAFTARIEAEIDEIAAGRLDWMAAVRRWAEPFEARLATLAQEPAAPSRRETATLCDRCGEKMAVRWGSLGPFLSCTGYPRCRNSRDLRTAGAQGGSAILSAVGAQGVSTSSGPAAAFPAAAEPRAPLAPQRGASACPRCGAAMIERRGRSGPFLACTQYPACKTSLPLSTGVRCPACAEGEIAEKRSRVGRLFFGCNRYPACDHAMRERPVPKACPVCKAPFLVQRFSRREGGIFACAQDGCSHWQPLGAP
jgi:DNA topoisomerase-1